MKIDNGNLTEGEGLCNSSIQAGRRKEDELSATGRVVVSWGQYGAAVWLVSVTTVCPDTECSTGRWLERYREES